MIERIERQVKTTTHGRYLVRRPAVREAAPMLVGFHGYAENAEVQLDRLCAIPGTAPWLIVSVQGLHRFYQPRTNQVVSSWMTRQDRHLAIADNVAYVTAALDAVAAECPTLATVVFAGFSQGVAMAFRAAASAAWPAVAVIAVGGDVPPELGPDALGHISATLVCRGAFDSLYSAGQCAGDVQRLRDSRVEVQQLEFEGGHEWSRQVADAAALFLGERVP
jgi:predicted esterase